MDEKVLNRDINRTFNEHGWSHKLSDPPKAVATTFGKNPFDGFSVVGGKHLYWESKLLKGYQAFPFARIRDHQIEALTKIKAASPEAHAWIIVGVWESRKLYDLYFFDICSINYLIERGDKSVKKKELLRLHNEGWSLPVVKKTFDVQSLWEKIIGEAEMAKMQHMR